MKKYFMSFVATLGLAGTFGTIGVMTVLPMTVSAAASVSDNASPNACFGQWRAADASGPYSGGLEGAALSQRQGSNATNNVSDKAACPSHSGY